MVVYVVFYWGGSEDGGLDPAGGVGDNAAVIFVPTTIVINPINKDGAYFCILFQSDWKKEMLDEVEDEFARTGNVLTEVAGENVNEKNPVPRNK